MLKPNDQMQAVLDAHAEMGPLPIEKLTHELARLVPLADRAALAVYGQHVTKRAFAPMPLPVGKVKHILIPSKESEIMARVYTPKGDAPKGGWPVLVYYHGGGWVIANLDTYDGSCRALCDGANCVVVSVHYRQAPEHQWPDAPNDAFDAYYWVLKNTMQLNGNANKIAIAGESAGGNLAAVVTLMAKEKNVPLPIHQLLIYPVTDLVEGMNSISAQENINAKPLNRAMLDWFYKHYVPDFVDRKNSFISPLYARSLAGLPSATIILAEIDPLRSEGETYGRKLRTSGVDVNMKIFQGVTHEFFGMAGIVSEATEAVAMASKDLRKAFDGDIKKGIAA